MSLSQPRTLRAYGLWSSPVGADVLAGGARFGDVAWADEDHLVWSESSDGLGSLFAAGPFGPRDAGDGPRRLTTDLNVRGGILYGGGEFTVRRGQLFFAADGGRLYRQSLAVNDPRPVTPAFGAAAAPAVHPQGRFVAYVHTAEDVDRLALVDAAGKSWPRILAEGADFYVHPAWHPDGTYFAYVCWNFPHMPWDETALHVAPFDADAPGGPGLGEARIVAGGSGVSVQQPTFSPDGKLLAYVSDETGYWQLYVQDLAADRTVPVTDGPYEHGVPIWVQGQRTYAFAPDGRTLFYVRNDRGWHRLRRVTLYDGEGNLAPRADDVPGLEDDYAVIGQLAVTGTNPWRIAFLGEGPATPPRVVVAAVAEGRRGAKAERIHVVRRSQAENFPPGLLSTPEPMQWSAPDGTTVHGLYYPPAHPRFADPSGLPPAVVNVHSGPTSQSVPEFHARAQFFTSRGYAYVEPNYRGSSGFGRAYRDMLRGRWGIVDVEDAVGAARRLVAEGRADEGRLVIMGSSAGGFTALRALVKHPGFFKAALTMYGVADLFGLAMDTHKFERRYTDQLVGPLPEAAAAYRERSPVFHGDKIRDPVAVFQGADDPVVPQSQADALVAALRRQGVPCEYYVYEGEGHGWRRRETVQAVYDAIDRFLRRHVIFS